jgi:hypothetical protein
MVALANRQIILAVQLIGKVLCRFRRLRLGDLISVLIRIKWAVASTTMGTIFNPWNNGKTLLLVAEEATGKAILADQIL